MSLLLQFSPIKANDSNNYILPWETSQANQCCLFLVQRLDRTGHAANEVQQFAKVVSGEWKTASPEPARRADQLDDDQGVSCCSWLKQNIHLVTSRPDQSSDKIKRLYWLLDINGSKKDWPDACVQYMQFYGCRTWDVYSGTFWLLTLRAWLTRVPHFSIKRMVSLQLWTRYPQHIFTENSDFIMTKTLQ